MSTLFRGLGLLVQDIDFSQAVPNERFECQTCHMTGPLTTNGRCGFCNSDAVVPAAVIEQ